jgi:hypothetical protein
LEDAENALVMLGIVEAWNWETFGLKHLKEFMFPKFV